MAFLDAMDKESGFLASDAAKSLGKDLTAQYNKNDPFPWIMIDDFLPEEIAQGMVDNFGPATVDSNNLSFDRNQERFKASYHPDSLNKYARGVFYAFNSRPFIKVIENITGISGLIPDPYYLGAGFHEISNGGHLSVHADFNYHKPMNLERRINVLIYLNKDWQEEFGGQLELWNNDMTEKRHSVVPSFNRCVIFNTTSNSMHGNPEVVRHPGDISRKSIALYYYTSTWDTTKKSHTTHFRARPETGDTTDWSIKLEEIRHDFIPPILLRNGARAGRLVGKLSSKLGITKAS
jgi:Rps23 Pro-64 3,4-dihydroxylase Tpa1-like proline 4-hydroxylase